jgi:polyisoprenoid-binding protein YceI
MDTLTATKTTWVIDALHSEISFKAKHLVITTVTGKFKSFSGHVETSTTDFSDAKIHFTADIASIDTGSEQRDGHLKSGEFFDAESFPTLSFVGDRLEKIDGEKYKLHGKLTIRNITQPVEMDVEYAGIHKDPFYGKTKAGFELNGKIHRKDFGLSWDVLTEVGSAVVSNDIRIHCNIQLDRVDA